MTSARISTAGHLGRGRIRTGGRRLTLAALPTGNLVSAHRGASRDSRPAGVEGSLSAYRAAVAAGASILDVDVQVTSDGVPVVMHDATVDATTAGTGNVSAFTRAGLPQLSMPEVVGAGWAAETVPTVDDVLAEFGGRVFLSIEPKTGAAGVPALAAPVHARGLQECVFLNTSSAAVAQTITDAGCLAHVYGVVSTAGIDAAVAAGADLIELPHNAATALVDHAVASGVHRFIAAPIQSFSQREAMDPRFHGYVSDAVGYLDRPGGKAQRSVSSLAASIAAARRGAGWLRIFGSSYGGTSWLTTSGILWRAVGDAASANAFHFGDLSGTPAASGSIALSFAMTTLPTDTNQRVGLRVLCPEEIGTGADSDTKGYVISLRANGQLNMWSSPLGAYGGGVSLGAIAGAPLVAGTVYQILFEWTATQVRLTRTDTGGTTGWVTNSDWRGSNIYSVTTANSGSQIIKNIVRTG